MLEGGLVTSFEKTIMDADLCGKLAAFFEGIDLSEEAFAMDAIRQVGPGAHFLDSGHTQANFARAFYTSIAADSSSFEQWEASGAQDAATRAHAMWQQLLADMVSSLAEEGFYRNFARGCELVSGYQSAL